MAYLVNISHHRTYHVGFLPRKGLFFSWQRFTIEYVEANAGKNHSCLAMTVASPVLTLHLHNGIMGSTMLCL